MSQCLSGFQSSSGGGGSSSSCSIEQLALSCKKKMYFTPRSEVVEIRVCMSISKSKSLLKSMACQYQYQNYADFNFEGQYQNQYFWKWILNVFQYQDSTNDKLINQYQNQYWTLHCQYQFQNQYKFDCFGKKQIQYQANFFALWISKSISKYHYLLILRCNIKIKSNIYSRQ